jgi:fructokinase
VEAVDPTGAGDAFTAAVIHRLAGGADVNLDAVLAFASAAGASAVQERGAMAGLPSEADVEAFLKLP